MTFAHEIDQQILQNGICLPSNLVQIKFFHYTLDDQEVSENTKDGTTMQNTVHNIYQYQKNC